MSLWTNCSIACDNSYSHEKTKLLSGLRLSKTGCNHKGIPNSAALANIGENCAVFEPVHGSAPDIKGQNKANPTALLLSAVEMLRYIGENSYAVKIERALFKTLSQNIKTADLGGNATTTEFTQKVIENL